MASKGRQVPQSPVGLIIADAVAHTGFSTVTHGVADNLKNNYNLHVLGINYYGDPHEYGYRIYPASIGGDVFGFGRTENLLQNIRPDFVLIINDPWVVKDYLPHIQRYNNAVLNRNAEFAAVGKGPVGKPAKVVAYIPIDGKNIRPEFGASLNSLDMCVAYTQFGAEQLINAGLDAPVSIIPHGIDNTVFSRIDVKTAREKIQINPNGDWFIVGCVNRNQPRKRLDLAIEYFAEFAKDKPETVKFYYHGALRDQGWDIIQLCQYYGIHDRLIITSPNITAANGVPRDMLRYIYGSFDVQLSTTAGEGWGLTNMEGMACGVPQIVPDWSALGEWCRGGAELIECTSQIVHTGGINTIGGIPDRLKTVEALNKMYADAQYRADIAEKGYRLVSDPKYTWKSVAANFDTVLKRVLKNGDNN